jgi:cell fate regulator YaaT (PSP1 superfamily)
VARYVVRFGVMRMLSVMSTRGSDRYSRSDRVIARTHRGLEEGEVLCEANEDTARRIPDAGRGQIIRRMTAEDYNDSLHLKSKLTDEFAICKKHVQALEMPMELVDLERIFGG